MDILFICDNATQRYDKPLDQDRIFGWLAAVFPTAHSGMYKVQMADCDCVDGQMEVVSGVVGRETDHNICTLTDKKTR